MKYTPLRYQMLQSVADGEIKYSRPPSMSDKEMWYRYKEGVEGYTKISGEELRTIRRLMLGRVFEFGQADGPSIYHRKAVLLNRAGAALFVEWKISLLAEADGG